MERARSLESRLNSICELPAYDIGQRLYKENQEDTLAEQMTAMMEQKRFHLDQARKLVEQERNIRNAMNGSQPRPIREFNMMSVNAWNPALRQPTMQTWDDGHQTRGRSPPPMTREETHLQTSNEPSPTTDTEELDYTTMEPPPITLEEESNTQTSYEIVELSPEIPETESEYSSDDEPDDIERCTMTIEASNPVARIISLISEDAGTIFPIVKNKRRLHPHRFEMLLEKMRALLWNYRQVNVDWDAYSYVLDRPPIGSKFDGRTGGYTAPDGVAISRTMRDRVRIVKERFREIQEIQEKWFEDELEYRQMTDQCTKSLRTWKVGDTDLTMTPVWRGMALEHIKTTTREPITTRFI
ncbi:MAG: hypothetical protein Q9183_007416 [Haloplaca sp. 2 TL-2023]